MGDPRDTYEARQRGGLKGVSIPPTRIWERQENEGEEAFEAWQTYLAIKRAGEGGLRECARRLGKNGSLIDRWAARWGWTERLRAYDNFEMLELERVKQQALRKEATVWAERRLGIREKGFELGEALIHRAKNLLSLPVFEKTVREVKIIKGEGGVDIPVETITVLEFQQHPRDARLMADTGIRLLRLSADMSTDNIAVPTDVDLEAMSDEDLDLYVDKMLEMRKQALGGGTEIK